MRVDHAGEYGANRIYAGQMAVLGHTQISPLIQVSVQTKAVKYYTKITISLYHIWEDCYISLERTAFSEVWCNMELGIQCDVECDDD